MQAKITKIEQYNPTTLYVYVNFFDGEEAIMEKTYPLPVDQDIASLYPQFKEDLNGLELAKQKKTDLEATVDKEVDLTDVKSTSELKAEAEQKAVSIASAEDLNKPLG